jgi:hypothetical protein
MSYVNTAPAAIAAAATQLEGVGTSFATESAGAASATTAIAPAAADEVSALQSGVFSTYGQLYQTVSAKAQAVHQQFVNTLQQSSGSYQETEAANQAGTAGQHRVERRVKRARPAHHRPHQQPDVLPDHRTCVWPPQQQHDRCGLRRDR